MAKYFIKSISIEGFRGINNEGAPLIINFQTDGTTSIFGENGKGKSSIFEAFVFSILGKILRIEDYHADIRDKKTIKNLFHSTDGTIIIDFVDETGAIKDINVKINTNGEQTVTSIKIANPEFFLSSLCSELNFLDHKSFEKIILSSAEDTGKLFANLVGFGSFISLKDKLDKISRTQNINTDFGKVAKENSIRNNNQKIADVQVEILKRLNDIEVSINPFNKIEIHNHLKSFLKREYSIKIQKIIDASQVDFDQLIKTKIGSQYEENVGKLNSEQDSLNEMKEVQKAVTVFGPKKISSLSRKLQAAYSLVSSQNDIFLGKLYEDAIKSYDAIADFNKASCILCDTENLGDSKNTFYQQINLKIKSFNKFKEKYMAFFEEFKHTIKSSKISEIEARLFSDEKDRVFSNIFKNSDFLNNTYFETINHDEIISGYRAYFNKEVKQADAAVKVLKALIPPKISELVEIHNAYKFVFNSIVQINELLLENDYNTKYLAELENWTSFIGQIKDDYEDAYNVLMDEIASMIDNDTKLFFKEIMGNVDIIPKLKKEAKGQKVNILLEKFYGNTTGQKAAALLSESYRNALSLSIYFAAALKSKSLGNFIIVDDITSSFDSGHQLYLLDLIKRKISINPANKKGKQIIFLTHDGLLKKVLNENDNNLKYWKHYNLNANKDVVSLKPFESNELKLAIQQKINNGNYVGSDFRMYYEFVLLEIIEKLNLEIPFSLINSNDDKMVGKLSIAIQEIIELKRASGKIRGLRLPNKNDFKIHTQQLANNLSHWASSSGISLSNSVLNRIVSDIDDFKKLFQYNCTCSRNAGWVYYKSLTSPKLKGCTCTI